MRSIAAQRLGQSGAQAGGTPGHTILFQPSRGNLGASEWMQQNSDRLVWIYQVQDGGGAKPGYALLGAIAEGPDANWFFKLTGPQKTVEENRATFAALIDSLKTGS